MSKLPDEAKQSLTVNILAPLLDGLDSRGPETWDAAFLAQAITGLRLLAKTEENEEHKEIASRLLVRYVQQLKLGSADQAGSETSPKQANPASLRFYDLPLLGSPLIFVWITDLGSMIGHGRAVEKEIANNLGDLVRNLPEDKRFNVIWISTKSFGKIQSLFVEPQPANRTVKLKAVQGLQSENSRPGGGDQRDLAGFVQDFAHRFSDGDVVLISLVNKVEIPADILDLVAQIPNAPRFHAVAMKPRTKKDEDAVLVQLVAATRGSAIQLHNSSGLGFKPNITVLPWDVSSLRPKTKP